MITTPSLLIGFFGGLLPALLWLWFWLKEDHARPEPKRFIVLAFLAGAIAVPLVIPLEEYAFLHATGTLLIFSWAAIEEVAKVLLVGVAVLGRKVVDEPIDMVIYMISAALGFAALENTLFLLNVFDAQGAVASVLTGNFRFLGAMLLHTLASAVVGVMLAFAFYRGVAIRIFAAIVGLAVATAFHGVFNLSIVDSDGENLLPIFSGVWIGIIALILIFEKIKRIRKQKTAAPPQR